LERTGSENSDASQEPEFLLRSKPKTDLSLFYSVNPQQLPKELDGVEWPLNA
jgi:hypothetical protein